MPEFFKMTSIHYKMTEAFLENHAQAAAPVYSLLEFQGTKIKSVPENVEVYLYGNLDGITGMMLVFNHPSISSSYLRIKG